MIEFKDFKRGSRMGGLVVDEDLSKAVAAMNAWLTEQGSSVRLMNVETMHSTNGFGGMTSSPESGVRVWFQRVAS